MSDTQALLADLLRAKVLFQQRALATIIHGRIVPAPTPEEQSSPEARVG